MFPLKNNRIIDIKEYFYQELSEICNKKELWSLFYKITSKFTDFSESFILTNHNERLNESTLLHILKAIKELKQFKPYQYIINEAYFLNNIYFVDESVLIPRPETEELIKITYNLIDKYIKTHEINETDISILDIGTGSGCIAISLKKTYTNSNLFAIDNSETALKTAKYNAEKLNVDVKFIKADILSYKNFNLIDKFDVIISNPPYVTNSEKQLMANNVLNYEPWSALFVENNNPLEFYEAICYFSQSYLKKNGIISLEINENYGNEMNKLLQKFDFVDVEVLKDFANKDRFCLAKK